MHVDVKVKKSIYISYSRTKMSQITYYSVKFCICPKKCTKKKKKKKNPENFPPDFGTCAKFNSHDSCSHFKKLTLEMVT